MKLICESSHLEDYLAELEEVDYSHPLIKSKAAELFFTAGNELETIQIGYEFVRDQIAHSIDIESTRVTRTASEVLSYKEGICYAKSNLLTALLRGQGIQTGFCYQLLTLGDTPDTGYCIHALNAVYLQSRQCWIRLDARGNKPGVDAQFSTDEEKLAFPVRKEFGEVDYPVIYIKPNANTMDVLKRYSDCQQMYQCLPMQL